MDPEIFLVRIDLLEDEDILPRETLKLSDMKCFQLTNLFAIEGSGVPRRGCREFEDNDREEEEVVLLSSEESVAGIEGRSAVIARRMFSTYPNSAVFS